MATRCMVPPNDETALMKAVAQQPVSVIIAIGPEFQDYTGVCIVSQQIQMQLV